jgi:hypothetical protein
LKPSGCPPYLERSWGNVSESSHTNYDRHVALHSFLTLNLGIHGFERENGSEGDIRAVEHWNYVLGCIMAVKSSQIT